MRRRIKSQRRKEAQRNAEKTKEVKIADLRFEISKLNWKRIPPRKNAKDAERNIAEKRRDVEERRVLPGRGKTAKRWGQKDK